MKTDHKQVPFGTLANGAIIEVDEGMHDILSLMRDLGLKTQFSCQDNLGLAYVVMDQKSANLFENLLRKSEVGYISRFILKKFIEGPRSRDLCLGFRRFTFLRLVWKRNSDLHFQVERLYQNGPHWLRTSYRWPATMSPLVLHMLEDVRDELG